jgi:alkylated DNA repair dioxygenase AlkB
MLERLSQNNFLVLPEFIDKGKAASLYEEFVTLANTGTLDKDHQAPNSPAIYNYLPFLELLCNKGVDVGAAIEETVLPTYSYARVYPHGEVLNKHTDRPACEISVTLHLGGDHEWPIFLEKPTGESVSLTLTPGDAVLYLGCTAPHWRDKYEGTQYAQVFLHYVRSRGPNVWSFFDNRR